MTRLLLALSAALWLVGCAQVCKPLTHRCLGTRAELCDGKGRKWRTVMDCSKLQPKDKAWRCCCSTEGKCSCKATKEAK